MATKKTLRPVTTVTIILGMLVLPAFPQDEAPPATRDASEVVSDYIADLMKEAEQGDASAQETLGNMYYNAKGVPQDYKEAARWYLSAAEQGDADAQNNLGVMYNKGQGVPQDYIQAHMWCTLAASHGGDDEREKAARNRDLLAEKMTSEQIAEAQRLAREWKPESGSQ